MATARLVGATPCATDEMADIQPALSNAIPWDAFSAAGLIGERELQALRRYDGKPEALQATLLDEFGPSIVGAIVSVLRNVSSEEAVQHALALLVEMCVRAPQRAALLSAPAPAAGTTGAAAADLLSEAGEAAPAPADACAVLLRLLQRPDWFTQEKAARVLADALAARPPRASGGAAAAAPSSSSSATAAAAAPLNGIEPAPGAGTTAADPSSAPDPITAAFLDWCCGQLRRPANPARSVPAAVRALSLLLRDKAARAAFTRAGGPALLCPLLRACGSPADSQLLYELCLCLWQLSFCRPGAEASAAAGAVPGLVGALRSAHKEKVVRVALFGLRNLLDADPAIEGAAHQAAESGLAKVVASRKLQGWADEDVAPALDKVGERLARGIETLSSWEAYRRELTSGSLDWGPVHTSEAFWRANASQFEERDFQPLRVLLRLLEASREPRTLAVGCHDLGKFVEHHPQGRFIAADLRGKELAMRLMAHPDADVQKRALIAVQKCMLPRDKLSFLSA